MICAISRRHSERANSRYHLFLGISSPDPYNLLPHLGVGLEEPGEEYLDMGSEQLMIGSHEGCCECPDGGGHCCLQHRASARDQAKRCHVYYRSSGLEVGFIEDMVPCGWGAAESGH